MEGASSSEGGGQGGKKGKKNKKDKKGGGGTDVAGNEGDWRWKNQLDMVKWTDRMINVSRTSYFTQCLSIPKDSLICTTLNFVLMRIFLHLLRTRCWDWSH